MVVPIASHASLRDCSLESATADAVVVPAAGEATLDGAAEDAQPERMTRAVAMLAMMGVRISIFP